MKKQELIEKLTLYLVEQFYQENHNYRRNEKRKRERRLRRKLETLDLIFEMEGWD